MASEDFAARLAALEDRLAIIELEAQYARRFDSRDGEGWAAIFTPDGVYQARDATPDGDGSFTQGRDELAQFCSGAPFDGIHLLNLPDVSVDGDSATSRVHFQFIGAYQGAGARRLKTIGYYDVSYRRTGDRWLIARRVTTIFSLEDEVTSGYPSDSGIPGPTRTA